MIISAVKAGEAAGVLGVELDGLTPDAIGQAYRKKTKECHPDHHGTTKLKQWSEVSWAKECLTHWIKQNPPVQSSEIIGEGDCRACGGTGRVKVGTGSRFGKPLTMQCVICQGEGSVTPKENDSEI